MSNTSRADDLIDTARAAEILGVTTRTMRYYTDTGRLPDRRNGTRRRKFLRSDLDKFKAERGYARDAGRQVVLYARVSSHRQAKEGDLARQVERLKAATGKQIVHSIHQDIASGLSEHRIGLRAALAACREAEVGELLVTHPERLARFGTGIIEQMLEGYGVKLRIVGEEELDKSEESALVRDMLAIVTSFSGRLYGQRSAKARAARQALAASLR